MMKCRKCTGRVFLDRIFSDNKNFEIACIMCGDREFVEKESKVGLWLTKMEKARMRARSLNV